MLSVALVYKPRDRGGISERLAAWDSSSPRVGNEVSEKRRKGLDDG